MSCKWDSDQYVVHLAGRDADFTKISMYFFFFFYYVFLLWLLSADTWQGCSLDVASIWQTGVDHPGPIIVHAPSIGLIVATDIFMLGCNFIKRDFAEFMTELEIKETTKAFIKY